ncbi:biorientation of chromosomes in cell division protein 1-like 1 isoform X2 [Durio zibethinus]|nr:biorientation of chromosomes in cell division protein 1-like 1 isoform X2 [Durio zibethinus]XP_022750316.1 biorientation of chromosomes in cell division protein 1-like 1 isoform X2 [Durio zibethinus]XP_022750317.1 biorientation of chromosomes in cell division protein 1-like 1 isoform X2 [Durio zibethinus]
MAASDKELELLLMEAGNKLLEPPSSVDELILLLDELESFLSRVEQSPSPSMQNALSPSLKALVAEPLFRHPDDDVNVAVAACISEITRITAPDAPYDDDQMREVFQLIVSSFENLSDKSSCLYVKRTSILETVAKVRSCVVMLDLECDALIIKMFQHFLKAIRDYHAEDVFTSMVTIMTLVLEESEDISVELLSPILSSVKKDNEEVLPVARRLAERVLENCASKLKPYLMQAVENLGISFDDYSSVVASICQVAPIAVEQSDATTDKRVDDESKPAKAPLDKAAQENKESPKVTVSTAQDDLANEKSSKSVVSNGIVQTAEDDSLADLNSLKKQEDDHLADKFENADTLTVAEPDILETEKVVNSDSKSEQSTQEKGRKSDSKSTEPSDSSYVNEKEAETLMDHKNDSKDGAHSPHEDPSLDEAGSLQNKRETDVQPSSPKVTEDESTNVASPTPSGTIPDESHPSGAARQKRKESLSKENTPVENVTKKASEGTSDSEAKTNRQSGKKVFIEVSNEDNVLADVDETKKESGTASDSEAKSLKQLSKKIDSSSKNVDGSSSRQLEDEKRRGRGKVVPEKDGTKTSTKNDDEEMVASTKSVKPNKHDSHMEETPKTNPKRKQTPSKEKASGSIEYGENLVGLKVKVWWPKDHMFYEGVIHSFDSVKKKHKVHYIDGDEEILNLKREKWEVIENESGSNEEEAADPLSPDSSSEMPQKKKAKTADQPSKKTKMDASPKRGGGASSGKSKGSATKSGRKTKEDGKVDGKSKDGSKSVSKSDNESATKAKDHTPKSGSTSVDVESKVGNKSKDEEGGETPKSSKSKDDDRVTPKASTKSEQDASKTAKSKTETPKISSNSKGKPLKSGGKSNANGTFKSKSGSSKVKESENVKENSTDSAKVVESGKRKSPSSSKVQDSDSKSGKKRRR